MNRDFFLVGIVVAAVGGVGGVGISNDSIDFHGAFFAAGDDIFIFVHVVVGAIIDGFAMSSFSCFFAFRRFFFVPFGWSAYADAVFGECALLLSVQLTRARKEGVGWFLDGRWAFCVHFNEVEFGCEPLARIGISRELT